MQNLPEKLKEFLLLSDEDIAPLLKFDFKTLLAQNKEAAVRVGIVYGCGIISVLLFVSLFSIFGILGKLFLMLLFFGFFGAMAFLFKDNLIRIVKYQVVAYFLMAVFGLLSLLMFSEVSTQGAFLSKFLMLLIIAGVVGGAYTLRQKAEEFGLERVHMICGGLVALSLLLSLQTAGIQFSIDREVSMAQQRSEIRRLRDAVEMRRNQASTKLCSSEEECRKMNMKKNSYYAQYEDVAQEICESAVAKEITGRFEWTVTPKDYKFNKYEVDVLKDEVTLFGDRAQLISNDGIKTKVMYTCRYNTKKKTALATVQTVK